MDLLVRLWHETTARRTSWISVLLSRRCMDLSCGADHIWFDYFVRSWCKVSAALYFFQHIGIYNCAVSFINFPFFLLEKYSCHNLTSLSTAVLRILPNYCATYVLLAAVMIVNPALYVSSTRNLQNAVSCSLSQVTGRERKLVQTIRLKFALTNIVYYVCWVPNLINGILLWTLWFQLPVKVIITLWYIMVRHVSIITIHTTLNFVRKITRFWLFLVTRRWRIHCKRSSIPSCTVAGVNEKNYVRNGVSKNWESRDQRRRMRAVIFRNRHRYWLRSMVTLHTRV